MSTTTALPESVKNTMPVHGFLGNPDWVLPSIAVECLGEARPGMEGTKAAHEYEEDRMVFQEKIKLLAKIIIASKNCIAYTGAGISTGAGVPDYASETAGKKSRVASLLKSSAEGMPISKAERQKKKISLWDTAEIARPTKAHHVLYRVYRAGWLKWWCQQNHDGLPQKAGIPQEIMNEIHGSWFDPTNRVIAFSEDLRTDLYQDLRYWERTADVCLAIGTSLSGMNSDRLAFNCGVAAQQKYKKYQRKLSLRQKKRSASSSSSSSGSDSDSLWNMDELAEIGGTVIIGFQCTRLDEYASLRIYSTIDKVFDALSIELISCMEQQGKNELVELFSAPYVDNPFALREFLNIPGRIFPQGRIIQEDVYELNCYDSETGQRHHLHDLIEKDEGHQRHKKSRLSSFHLDLRKNSQIEILIGIDRGCTATVVGKDEFGHYHLDCEVMCRYTNRSTGRSYRAMGHTERVMGIWMIIAALEGKLPSMTIKNPVL